MSATSICDESPNVGAESPTSPKSRWLRNLEPRATWIIFFCSILPINIIIGIDTVGFGIYYVAYSEYFLENSSTEIGFIVSVKMGLMFSFGIVTSTLLDHYGCRRVSLAGGAISCTAMVLASFAPSVLVLFLTQGCLLGIGGSLVNMTTNCLTQHLFTNNRAMGGGLCMLGFTIGNVIAPVVIDFLISIYGWRGSLLLQAAFTANIVALSIVMPDLMHESPTMTNPKTDDTLLDKRVPDAGLGDAISRDNVQYKTSTLHLRQNACIKYLFLFRNIFDFSLLRKFSFTLVVICGMADRFNLNLFRQHIPSRAVYLGMSRTAGAKFLLANGIALLICRVVVTFAANLPGVSCTLVYGTGTLLGAISSYLVVVFPSYTGQLVMSILDGIHAGMTNTLYAVMLVELAGVQRLSKALAIYGILVGIAVLAAAPLGGYVYEVTSNYDIPFLIAGSVAIVGGISGTASAMLHIRKHRLRKKYANNDMEDIQIAI